MKNSGSHFLLLAYFTFLASKLTKLSINFFLQKMMLGSHHCSPGMGLGGIFSHIYTPGIWPIIPWTYEKCVLFQLVYLCQTRYRAGFLPARPTCWTYSHLTRLIQSQMTGFLRHLNNTYISWFQIHTRITLSQIQWPIQNSPGIYVKWWLKIVVHR